VPVLIGSARPCGEGVAGAFRLFLRFLGAKFIKPDIKIISVFETVLMIIGIYTLGIKTLEHE